MNKNSRKIILISLVVALLLGGFIGSYWGGEMNSAIEAKKDLRSLDKRISNLKAGDASAEEINTLKEEREIINVIFEEKSFSYSSYTILKFFGKLFLSLLNLLVIPLVISSIIIGMSQLGDIRHAGRTGLRTIIYYFATTSVAVVIGIVLVSIISPGVGIEESAVIAEKVHGKEGATIMETVLRVFVNETDKAKGAFPSNIFAAMANMNVLGVIVFSLIFGAALTTIGEKGKLIFEFFDGVNLAVLQLVHWVLYLLPIGVMGLVTARLAEMGGGAMVWMELSRIGYYAFTVILALLVHGVIILPIVLYILTKRSPIKFFSGMSQALLTAFSTASSSATLPTTMECVEENNKVSRKSAS
ncbi:MAG: dicarboxylate/amino acid:cation symporter, partial [Deltaproteobacteria bacterium]|nr:dicarboxylate/amino acid:cation symporter [Deltaproteobacteria bacterium]